jgi:hypothetical protein
MNASQKRAVANHRRRLGERGLARYEVRGLEQDKELVRQLAKRLAANDHKAAQLRADIVRETRSEPTRKGGIYAALRRSPAVGADLDLSREIVSERDIDL